MTEKRFEVELPEEMLTEFGWREADVPDKIREALVMELLRQHTISQGKTAELLRFTQWDIYEVMGRYNVPAIDLTPTELQRELAKAKELPQSERV